MRKTIIDTNTGNYDTVALAVAMNQKDIEILGIIIVAGNCDLYQETQNALVAIEYCNKKIPAYLGCSQPLLREQKTDVVQDCLSNIPNKKFKVLRALAIIFGINLCSIRN